MQTAFVHPHTKEALDRDSERNLLPSAGGVAPAFKPLDGSYDFAAASPETRDEREYYDKEYGAGVVRTLETAELEREWFDGTMPWRRRLLESLGPLSGKRMLLLGNGTSTKEIYFVHLGAHVVFTDLSIEAMKCTKAVFRKSEVGQRRPDQAEFHAADALHLPFADESFDIIYGWAFAHHLSDLEPFLREVRRCLKPGGRCRFADEAFSPAWQKWKLTWLRPLMRYSHRKVPRSPEDNRATVEGGYRREDLLRVGKKAGFADLVFQRESFFLRLFQRHYGLMLGWNRTAMWVARPLFYVTKALDWALSGTKWMAANRICLSWGYDK